MTVDRSARRSLLPALLAFSVCALLVGPLSASWASGASAKESSDTLDLTGVVTKVQKPRVEEEETEELHSTIELTSGSKSAGTLDTEDCSDLAIHFLICSGKASIEDYGSDLTFHVEWPCVEGAKSLNCSSVGDGIVSKGEKTRCDNQGQDGVFQFHEAPREILNPDSKGSP